LLGSLALMLTPTVRRSWSSRLRRPTARLTPTGTARPG
jgi:hypothetical protein